MNGNPSRVNIKQLCGDQNSLEQGSTHKPMIVEVSYDLRAIPGGCCPSLDEFPGNHRRDNFMSLETIRRLNPFSCAKLTTFAVICNAYDDEPTLELFRGFFSLYPGGQWLTFAKRLEKHIFNLLPKVITRIERWKGICYYNLSFVLPSLLLLIVLHIFAGDMDVPELQNATACHLKISNITPSAWRGHLYNQVDDELLDLHDLVKQIKRECKVLKEKEKARDKECEELNAKCEAVMADFNNNPVVKVLRQKIMSLLGEVKEHKASLDRMMRESRKWAGYQENLMTLELKVSFLEAKKSKLEVIKTSLRQEIETIKCDRVEVVLKVVPYVAMNLVQSDEMGRLIIKLVSSVVFYGRCATFKEVTDMKEPFGDQNSLEQSSTHKPMIVEVSCDLRAIPGDRELLTVVKQIKRECKVLKEKEKARDKECEELKAKCEAVMADFNNNPIVKVLRQKIMSLLEAKKSKLEVIKTSLRQDIETVKCDRVEVVLKVVPYVAMNLVQSDEMGRLITKLVSSVVFYGRCATFKEVTDMKEPFDLAKFFCPTRCLLPWPLEGHYVHANLVPRVACTVGIKSIHEVTIVDPQD
nr:hypothetical protein [Tanacetum cinerariifolium]